MPVQKPFTSGRSAVILILALSLALIGLFDGRLSNLLRFDPGEGALVTEIGFWLGHGAVNLTIFLGLYLLARRFDRPRLRAAAGQAFWTFILSGALAQLVKHLVGRPRPRLWDEGVVHFGPSIAAGIDSFPSGHTTTSVAVALVLSYHYPWGAPLFMGLAAFVAMSRLTGGSHFPLDVLGGIVLGVLAAWAVIHFTRKPAGIVKVGE